MKTAALPENVRAAMISHGRAELPNECCGLLLGRGHIERTVPMRSLPPAPDAYCMDPAQQIEVFNAMQAAGERLLGIYHSHPAGPAQPSGMDLRLAFHTDALYCIISLADPACPVLTGYRLANGAFAPVALCSG